MRVQVLPHQPGLPLRALCLDGEQVAAEPQTQLLLVYRARGKTVTLIMTNPFTNVSNVALSFSPTRFLASLMRTCNSPLLSGSAFFPGEHTSSNKCHGTLSWPTLRGFFTFYFGKRRLFRWDKLQGDHQLSFVVSENWRGNGSGLLQHTTPQGLF